MKLRLITSASVLALGLAAAGCGSDNGIQQAPSSTVSSIATSTTQTTPVTPTSGPLATEPAVPPQTGAPPTKLITKDVVVGTGPEAKNGSSVTVNYVGALFKGGKVFDSSWSRHQPATFTLTTGPGGVIPGWVQGLQGMKVGGRRLLIIPAPLGYGAQGQPPAIPPNATLVFVVDLLGVQ